MVVLDGSVRLVALQFSFSNPGAIPPSVKSLGPESFEERDARKSQSTGTLVIEPTENVFIPEFLIELEASGYEMVSGFYKERLNPKDSRGKRTYHMVRFLFARHEYVSISEYFRSVRDTIRAELRGMCEAALWRVRVFSNPLYKDGEEVFGKRAVSINLEVRKPLFHPNGQPVMQWDRDEHGEKVSEAPLPLHPGYCLRILGQTVQLVPT